MKFTLSSQYYEKGSSSISILTIAKINHITKVWLPFDYMTLFFYLGKERFKGRYNAVFKVRFEK